jgi:hypothetical protein
MAVGHEGAEQRAVELFVSASVVDKIRQAGDFVDIAAPVLVDSSRITSAVVCSEWRHIDACFSAELDAVKFGINFDRPSQINLVTADFLAPWHRNVDKVVDVGRCRQNKKR